MKIFILPHNLYGKTVHGKERAIECSENTSQEDLAYLKEICLIEEIQSFERAVEIEGKRKREKKI